LFKKTLLALIIFFVVIFITGYFFTKPIILSISRMKLEAVFKGASVSVKDCSFKPRLVSFYNIEVKKDKAYDIKIEEAGIAYDFKTLFKKNIAKVSLNNVLVDINPLKTFSAERIDILNLNPDSAGLYIPRINYDNLKTGEIKSSAKFRDNAISISPLSIDFLGGTIAGDLNILILSGGIVRYDFNLKALNLNIRSFVEDFKLIDKFEMTGRLEGAMSLAGSGQAVNELNGAFFTAKPGGVLIIKDTKFLENVAKNSKQPLDIIVESFKNYNYNSGILKLYMDNGNLVLDVNLNGQAGKRNLTIVLHNFKK
jgi:hypothetical protein